MKFLLKKTMAQEGKGAKGVRGRDIPATSPFTDVRTS